MTISSCARCGTQFNGRANKKFCSAECKIQFNNIRAAKRRSGMKEGEKHLRNNYAILMRLNDFYGENSIEHKLLHVMGFNADYFTGLKKIEERTVYQVFDIYYEIDSPQTFKIHKK